MRIKNCNDDFIDIRENANNTILCTGFFPNDTIVWIFKGENISGEVATCDENSKCTVHASDHVAVQRSPRHSTLFYQRFHVDKVAKITCESRYKGKRSTGCKINVINPATLSSCAVEEDRESGTVRGSCRFEHAYSDSRGFQCTWYQEEDRQSKRLVAIIKYDSGGSQGPGGWCIVNTTWKPGTYTYSINFYPGPGNFTVDIGNLASSSPVVSPPTDNVVSTSSPDVTLQTTKDSVDYTSPKTQEENNLPLGAIVGGIVAVVAVIIIVVVVVVVCVMRKRKQKPAGSQHGSSNDASNENDDFEEHNGHPAAPHSLDADVYTTVLDEARYGPNSEANRSGGYEDIGFGSNGNKRAPQKDEYAVVDKSRAKKAPASSANTSASSPAHTNEGSDEYAVVDKSSSRNKAAKNVASAYGLSDAATSNAGADVYAQVNKSAKKVNVAELETEGPAYAQVQKPKPAVKPKTSAKPLYDKDVTQRSTAYDDEYHTLSHTRGSPHTQDQADLESQYSHIGHD